jgi:Putative zinc-finger
LAIIGFVWFDEPQLHKAAERVSLASHVAVTFRTMTREPAVLRVLLLVATAALLSQAVFEFGSLWLVALAALAVVYGMLFLPFSLAFGWVAQANGVNWSGWMLAGAVVVVGVLLIVSIRAAHRDATAQADEAVRAEEAVGAEGAVGATGLSEELACRQLVELVADYLDGLLPEKMMADVEDHLAGCDGCTAYVSQIRQTIVELRRLAERA